MKKNYTTKKIKCLGQYQNDKYLDILHELKHKRSFQKKQIMKTESKVDVKVERTRASCLLLIAVFLAPTLSTALLAATATELATV